MNSFESQPEISAATEPPFFTPVVSWLFGICIFLVLFIWGVMCYFCIKRYYKKRRENAQGTTDQQPQFTATPTISGQVPLVPMQTQSCYYPQQQLLPPGQVQPPAPQVQPFLLSPQPPNAPGYIDVLRTVENQNVQQAESMTLATTLQISLIEEQAYQRAREHFNRALNQQLSLQSNQGQLVPEEEAIRRALQNSLVEDGLSREFRYQRELEIQSAST